MPAHRRSSLFAAHSPRGGLAVVSCLIAAATLWGSSANAQGEPGKKDDPAVGVGAAAQPGAPAPAAAAPVEPGPAAPAAAPPPPAPVRPEDRNGTPLASDVIHRSDFIFMDTRLTWTFGDDDVSKATGEAFPLSPKPSVGDRPQYRLFFDNLNSRFGGRENLSHLVLYKKMPGFIEGVETEAAMVLRVDLAQLAGRSNNVNSAFYDSGSYLRIFYKTGSFERNTGLKVEKRSSGIDLVFFPLDTDRFRLGYLYDLSWGGTAQAINQSIFPRLSGTAPGAKFQYTGNGFYTFIGVKTAQIVEPQRRVTGSQDIEFTRQQETNYGLLGGLGVDVTENLRADAGAGYFQQGRFEQPDVLGQRVYTFGASARVVVHDKMPVPASVDFALYRNNPNSPMVIFRQETYSPGQFAWAVTAEGSQLRQNLKNFERPGATTLQAASAGALQATIKAGYFRIQGTGIYRDLAFVLRNQPSFIPFETMPKQAKLQPEMFFALAGDYYLEKLHLTPGLGMGLQLPATFSSDQTDKFGIDIGRTTVVRQQGNLSPLPETKTRVPIIQARASLRWDLSPMMAAIFWGQFVRDNNATRLQRAEDGTTLLRVFVAPDFIGFGTSVQARF
jgi:hypothetical protein